MRARLLAAARSSAWCGASLLAAAAALHVASVRGLELPGAPWALWPPVATAAAAGALWGLWRTRSVARILHGVDRVHGLDDLLLCSHEVSARSPDQLSSAAALVLERAESRSASLELSRSLPLKPLVILLPLALAGLALTGARHVPPPVDVPETLHVAGSGLPEHAPDPPPPAPLRQPREQDLLSSLKKQLEALEAGADGDAEGEASAELSALIEQITRGEHTAREALARLQQIRARLKASARAAGDEEALAEEIARRLKREARRLLAEHGRSLPADAGTSEILDALARLARHLAEQDPERFEEMARRLARSLADRDLRKLLERRDSLAKKLRRELKRGARSAAARRRLERLKKRLEKTRKAIERAAREGRPGLEELRRNLERQAEKKEDAGTKDQRGRGGAKQEAPTGEPTPGRGRAEQKTAETQDAEQATSERGSRKSGRSGAGASRRSREIERLSRALRRKQGRARLDQDLDRLDRGLREDVARRRAQARLRRYSRSHGRAGARPGAGKGPPGSEHVEGGAKPRPRKGRVEDTPMGAGHGPGGFRTVEAPGADTVGKERSASKGRFDPDAVEDALLRARIPERYRPTVRAYFELLAGAGAEARETDQD